MIYILISICCSVLVSILLKIAKRYEVNMVQAIGTNYLIAATASALLFPPQLSNTSSAPWAIYATLGILLPVLFVILAQSVKHSGIVRTDIAQRLSLLIPLLAAFLLFNEHLSTPKILAIGIGLIAVICSIPFKNEASSTPKSWVYPLLVFVGMGLIDVLFKQLAIAKSISFTTSLFLVFCLAIASSWLLIAYTLWREKKVLKLKNILFGVVLGVFNYGNIFFYLKAHQALNKQPSVVFTSMNIGVIALGSLIGLWAFKERLSALNYIGIALAIASILVISMI